MSVIDELKLLGVVDVPKHVEPEPPNGYSGQVIESVVSPPEPVEPVVTEAEDTGPEETTEEEFEVEDRLVGVLDTLQTKLLDLAAAVIQAAKDFSAIAEAVRGTDGEPLGESEDIKNEEV